MSWHDWFRRTTERIQDDTEFEDLDDIYSGEEEASVEPPTPLAKLMERVLEYREQEARELRSEAYGLRREVDGLKRDLEMVRYERNEALSRIGKVFAILNKKQQAQLAKPPVELKFGPPPLQYLGYDERGKFRHIEVPQPAKMETIEREGKGPQAAGNVLNSDRRNSGRD